MADYVFNELLNIFADSREYDFDFKLELGAYTYQLYSFIVLVRPPSLTTTSTPRMSLPTCSPTGAPRARPAPPVPGLAAFAAPAPHRRLTGFSFHANLVSTYLNILTNIVLP